MLHHVCNIGHPIHTTLKWWYVAESETEDFAVCESHANHQMEEEDVWLRLRDSCLDG